MNETHLLTDAQIARRETAAIWLIGVGLLLHAITPIFNYVIDILGDSFEYPIVSISRLLKGWVANIAIICGLWLCKAFAGRNTIFLFKHWIIALFCLILQPLIICLIYSQIRISGPDDFLVVVLPGLPHAITLLCILYMFWAMHIGLKDWPQEKSIHKVRLIYTGLLLLLFLVCTDEIVRFNARILTFRHEFGYDNIIHGLATELTLQQSVNIIWKECLICFSLFLSGLMFCGIRSLVGIGPSKPENMPLPRKSYAFLMGVVLLLALYAILGYYLINWRTISFFRGEIGSFVILFLLIFSLLVLIFYKKVDRKLFPDIQFGYGQIITCYILPFLCLGFLSQMSGQLSSNSYAGFYWSIGLALNLCLMFLVNILYSLWCVAVRVDNVAIILGKFVFLSICSGSIMAMLIIMIAH